MKLIYYMEYKNQDLKLRVQVSPVFNGEELQYYDIEGITLINFHKEYILSQYSSLYRELKHGLETDQYFDETIISAHRDEIIDMEIEQNLIGCNYD